MTVHVIYHSPCMDGAASAFVLHWFAYDIWGVESRGLSLHPFNVKDKVQNLALLMDDFKPEDEVWVVDFSFPLPALIELSDKVSRVIVLDHHKTFREEAGRADDLRFEMKSDNLHIVYDNDKCGAKLVLDYVYSHFEVEENPTLNDIVSYVQDRDLWKWQLPNSEEINAALATFDPTVDELYQIYTICVSQGIECFLELGRALLVAQENRIEHSIANVRFVTFYGYEQKIPCVNSQNDVSETAAALLEKYPNAPFAAVYYQADGFEKWSLRSRPGGDTDVSELAKARGGGGHRTAAGFTVPWDDIEIH